MTNMVDWPNIDTVLLDMDGTLLDLRFDNVFWQEHLPKRYAQIHAVDHQYALQKLQTGFDDERGTLNWYCTQYWAAQLHVDIVALKHEISHHIKLLDHVIEFLSALQQANKTIILVTNAHRESYDLKMAHIDLQPYFDHVVSSHDYGHPKEDQKFWQQLHTKLPFERNTSLFIDDNETVLQAAHDFGIKHLLAPQQPDSSKAARRNLKHPSFEHYAQLLPIST